MMAQQLTYIAHTVQLSSVPSRLSSPYWACPSRLCPRIMLSPWLLPAQAERLAQRLQSICAEEGLRCEKSTLRLLVERTDCDIRSCLNTLQVGRRAGGRAAGRGDVVDCCIGR